VADNTTFGAALAWKASCHLGAHKHHWLPGFKPIKPIAGIDVDKSFPAEALYSRNSFVTIVQTVWLPTSSSAVSQQPFLKNPVSGELLHSIKGSPKIFMDSFISKHYS
jgi:hypothetical protein